MKKDIKLTLVKLIFMFGLMMFSSITVTAQQFSFDLSLEKQDYLLNETIWLDATLTNISTSPLNTDGIAAPEHGGLTLKIINESGKLLDYTGPLWLFAKGEVGYYLLEPGDKQYNCFGLNYLYGVSQDDIDRTILGSYFPQFPVGSYTIQGVFEGVKSNLLSFNVIEPSGDEKEVFDLLIAGSSSWRKSDRIPAGNKFQEILDRFPNTVYGETCFHLAKTNLGTLDGMDLTKQKLERFPNSGSAKGWLNAIIANLDKTKKEAVFNKTISDNPNSRAAKFAKQIQNELILKQTKEQ